MYITVKGMSRQSIQKIKAILLCIEYGILFVDTVNMKIKACNTLNAMFVNTVDTLVFVALTQHLIQSTMRCENSTLLHIKWSLAPPSGKVSNVPSALWVLLFTRQSEEAALLTFLDLSNYKGDCRQDAQPIPNS